MEIIKVSTNLYRGDKINDIKEVQEIANNRKSVAFQVGGCNKRWMVKPASWVLGWNYSDIQKYIMNNNMYRTIRRDEVVEDAESEDDPVSCVIVRDETEIEVHNPEEELDLTKILYDCKGIKLYSTIYGECTFLGIENCNYPILINVCNKDGCKHTVNISSNGSMFDTFNGECTLFPSKTQRDWSKFVKPRKDLKEGEPVMVSISIFNDWRLKKYYHCDDFSHVLSGGVFCEWKHIVPVNKFDFDNLTFDPKDDYGTESKYNKNK